MWFTPFFGGPRIVILRRGFLSQTPYKKGLSVGYTKGISILGGKQYFVGVSHSYISLKEELKKGEKTLLR